MKAQKVIGTIAIVIAFLLLLMVIGRVLDLWLLPPQGPSAVESPANSNGTPPRSPNSAQLGLVRHTLSWWRNGPYWSHWLEDPPSNRPYEIYIARPHIYSQSLPQIKNVQWMSRTFGTTLPMGNGPVNLQIGFSCEDASQEIGTSATLVEVTFASPSPGGTSWQHSVLRAWYVEDAERHLNLMKWHYVSRSKGQLINWPMSAKDGGLDNNRIGRVLLFDQENKEPQIESYLFDGTNWFERE